jgi:hypothetical protein
MIRFFNTCSFDREIMRKILYFLLLNSWFLFLHAQNNYVFGPSIRVSDDPPGSSFHSIVSSGQHGIACSGDTVYCVWRDERLGYGAVYFSKSTDAGQTWGSNVRAAGGLSSFRTSKASIALDVQGNIYVVFSARVGPADDDVYFVKSTDGGATFSDSVLVNDTTRTLQNNPSIAVDSNGQNVFIAWVDARNPIDPPNYDIYFSRSTDGGLTFLPSIRIDDTGSDSSWQLYASIGCTKSGDTVYVAWYDGRHGNTTQYDIYFSRSVDGGQTFEPNIIVNDTAGIGPSSQSHPSLWVSNSGTIYIVWQDHRNGYYQIYCDKSLDGGVTFNQDVKVSDDSCPAIGPSVAVDDSERIYVAWQDVRNSGTSEYDIYFSYSSDSGNTFSEDVRVNDLEVHPAAWDWNANIAANNQGRVFVAWDTDRHEPYGDTDIYFATGIYQGIHENKNRNIKKITMQVSPNPFTNKLRIILPHLGSEEDIVLRIYDISGRCVKTLYHHNSDQIIWTGIDDRGKVLPAGIYFCQIAIGRNYFIKKVVKID